MIKYICIEQYQREMKEQQKAIERLKKTVDKIDSDLERFEEGVRKAQQKRQQAIQQLDQLQTLRTHVVEMSAAVEEEIERCQSLKRIQALKGKQIAFETRLCNIDTRIAKLWDVAYTK